ncbi:MAG: RHS repeat protein, partial [Clostridiales bacterium]|nr:RHS repeat protein [Clostridiales bacterium]
VNLRLTVQGYGNFSVKSITSPWLESEVTYISKPSFFNEVLDNFHIPSSMASEGRILSLDVTKHYTDWQSGALASGDNGVAIIAEPTEEALLLIGASEASGSGQPTFEITYTEANNMDGVVDTHSFNVGRAGTLYVNDRSREAYVTRSELGIDGNIMPVSIMRHFNSRAVRAFESSVVIGEDEYVRAYGNGWLTNYNMFLLLRNDTEAIGFADEHGDVSYFFYDENASSETKEVFTRENTLMTSSGGSRLEIDDLGIKLIKSSGETLYFDDYYRVIKIEDNTENKNSITIDYLTPAEFEDGTFSYEAISKITDGVRREYRFTYANGVLASLAFYDASGNPITVSGSSGAVNLAMSYTYGDAGGDVPRLTKATYPDGEEVTYVYLNEEYINAGRVTKRMSSMTDINGYVVSCGYNALGKVSSVLEESDSATGNVMTVSSQGGSQNTFEYRYGGTLSPVNELEIKQFDSYGRTLNVRDINNNFVGAVYSGVTVGDKSYNILSDISGVISANSGTGLLTNAGFANGVNGWTQTNTVITADGVCGGSILGRSGSNVFKMTGAPAVSKSISQTLTLTNAHAGDIITLGGWARANALPSREGAQERRFGLRVSYTYITVDENDRTVTNTVNESVPFST